MSATSEYAIPENNKHSVIEQYKREKKLYPYNHNNLSDLISITGVVINCETIRAKYDYGFKITMDSGLILYFNTKNSQDDQWLFSNGRTIKASYTINTGYNVIDFVSVQ